jgi:hypothetical protein
VILTCLCQGARAQEVPKQEEGLDKSIDTNYIADFTELYTLQLFTIQKYTRLHLNDKFLDRAHSFFPNEQTNLGFGFNYKWMGLTLAVNPNRSRDVETLGQTKKIDLQLFSYGRVFGLDINLSRYRGFYLNNPSELEVPWDGKHYPLRPDIEVNQVDVNWFYVKNHRKFSYRAAFTQNEEQKKSAGSLVFGAFAGNTGVQSLLGLQTTRPEDLLVNNDQLRGGRFSFLGGGAGYAGSLAHPTGWYGTLSVFLGFSAQYSSVRRLDGETFRDISFSSRSHTRLSLGYNHKWFFAGIAAIGVNRVLVNSNRYELRNEWGQLRFFLGKRFAWKPIRIEVPELGRN